MDFKKRRDELAKAICTVGPLQHAGFIQGYDQARADMLEALGEWDIRAADKSAVEYAHTDPLIDIERAWAEGTFWQFEQIKKKLGLG